MKSTGIAAILSVTVPWFVGGCAIWYHKHPNQHMQALLWFILLILNLVPLIQYEKSRDLVSDLIENVFERTWDSVINVIGYLVPFAIYPAAILSIKMLLHSSIAQANASESDTDNEAASLHLFHKQREQSKLITWILKVLIMIFALFAIVEGLGLQTGDALQITSIFSLGLSWSMRDWLSSLWAAFLMAFTTDVTVGVIIQFGIGKPERYRVMKTGLMFLACKRINDNKIIDNEIIHFPNSVLLNNGFVICH
jgi:small-conductance mechanosensitive channel